MWDKENREEKLNEIKSEEKKNRFKVKNYFYILL